MSGHAADDPTLNDDSQPSVTTSAEAARLADLAAGVTPAAVVVRAPADAIDLEVRKNKADQSAEEVAAELLPVGEGTDAGAAADEEAGEFGTGPYEGRTNAELQALLASKGLPTSGSKDELIERLRA